MRHLVLLFLTILAFLPSQAIDKISCQIDFNVKGLENKQIIFAFEYGNKEIVLDTIKLDNYGKGAYTNKHRLTGGIYIILLPNKKYFELLVNEEQFFTVITDTANYIGNLVIEGSDESDLFRQYVVLCLEFEKAQNKYKVEVGKKDATIQPPKGVYEISSNKKAITLFTVDVLNNKPKSFLAAYLRMKQDVELPEQFVRNSSEASREFFSKRYLFLKSHYFDYVDFSDIRLLRTRLLFEKFEYFFNVFIAQDADSLCKEIDIITSKAKINDESYKYVLNFLNTNYRIPKNQNQEMALVYLADNFYLNGKAPWADPRFIKLFQERVDLLRPALLGVKAANIELQTIDGELISVYNQKAEYLILYFWSPDCNICAVETPKMFELYNKIKGKNVRVMAVYTHADKALWQNELANKDYDWLNVYDPMLKSNFSKLYNVDVTPKIYILDKDKKIVAKGNNTQVVNRYFRDK